MIENGRWHEERLVSESETLATTPLTDLCLALAQAAGAHAEGLGYGIEDLRNRSLTWMLSRLRVRVSRYPVAGERLTISTWPSGVLRLLALRDFRVTAEDGSAIVVATTGWYLVDLKTRRPVKPDAQLSRLCLPERALDTAFDRIAQLSSVGWRQGFAVREEDIDANDHVTFTSYIAWIERGLRGAQPAPGTIADMEINYLAEVFRGQQVRVEGGATALGDGRWPITVVREADQAAAAQAAVGWA